MLLLDYRYHRDNIITKLPGWLRDHVGKLNTLHSTVSSIKQVCENNNNKSISPPKHSVFDIWITIKTFKAELNPMTAKLGWCAYLVPFLVLDNIRKCKNSQSTRADWTMISNRPANNIKRESFHHSLQWNTVLHVFCWLIWFCWAAIFFYFHQVLWGLWCFWYEILWGKFKH